MSKGAISIQENKHIIFYLSDIYVLSNIYQTLIMSKKTILYIFFYLHKK